MLSKQRTLLKVLGFTLHTWNRQHTNRIFLTSQTFSREFVATLGILLSYCKALFRSNIWWLWIFFLSDLFIFSNSPPPPIIWEGFQWAYSLLKQRGEELLSEPCTPVPTHPHTQYFHIHTQTSWALHPNHMKRKERSGQPIGLESSGWGARGGGNKRELLWEDLMLLQIVLNAI